MLSSKLKSIYQPIYNNIKLFSNKPTIKPINSIDLKRPTFIQVFNLFRSMNKNLKTEDDFKFYNIELSNLLQTKYSKADKKFTTFYHLHRDAINKIQKFKDNKYNLKENNVEEIIKKENNKIDDSTDFKPVDVKKFAVFSNFNDKLIEKYVNMKLITLTIQEEDRLVGVVNKFLSVDHNYIISKDDLMSKDEIFEGVKSRFLSNYNAFNNCCELLRERGEGKDFITFVPSQIEWDKIENASDLNVNMLGILSLQTKPLLKGKLIPFTKILSDVRIRFLSISKFNLDMSRFIPGNGPISLFFSFISHYRKSNEHHYTEKMNIFNGDFLIPRFILTFDEEVILYDREKSKFIEPSQIIKRNIVLDFFLIGNKNGFSFHEHFMNYNVYDDRMEKFKL